MSRKLTKDDDYPHLPLGVVHRPGFPLPATNWLDEARATVLRLSETFLQHWPAPGTATRLRSDCYSTASHALGALGAALGAITSVERAETRGEHVEAPAPECRCRSAVGNHAPGCPAYAVAVEVPK